MDALWHNSFKICLAQCKLDIALLEYLDDILDWYSKRNVSRKGDLLSDLISKYGEEDFRRRYEEVVGQFLTHHSAYLFPLNLEKDKAKLRYRLLIRVFHPDRGVKDTQWLTACSEIINRTYNEYVSCIKEQERRAELIRSEVLAYDVDSPRMQGGGAEPVVTRRKGLRSIRWFQGDYWRNLLGDPDNLQYRIAYGLAGLVSLILMVILASVLFEPTMQSKVESASVGNQQHLLSLEKPEGLDGVIAERHVETEYGEDLTASDSTEDVVEESLIDFEAGSEEEEAISGFVENEASSGQSLESEAVVTDRESVSIQKGKWSFDERDRLEPVLLSDLELNKDVQKAENSVTEQFDSSFDDEHAVKEHNIESVGISECVESESFESSTPLYYGTIKADSLRLREGPSGNCAIKSTLDFGEKVTVLKYSENQHWVYVSFDSDSDLSVFGWVSKKYVSTLPVAIEEMEAPILVAEFTEEPANSVVMIDNNNQLVGRENEDGLQKVSTVRSAITPEMLAMFDEYQNYFVAGDDRLLASLYLSGANKNGLSGVSEIKRFYKELFSLTNNRSLSLEAMDIKNDGYYSARIDGKLKIGYLIGHDQYDELRDFKMLLVKTQKGLKIALFDFG